MIKKIKDLISNFSSKEEIIEESDLSSLNNACAALLVEIAFADKDFDETEKQALKQALIQTYDISESEIQEIIEDAETTVDESTSLYGYTRIVNDEFGYEDKLIAEVGSRFGLFGIPRRQELQYVRCIMFGDVADCGLLLVEQLQHAFNHLALVRIVKAVE